MNSSDVDEEKKRIPSHHASTAINDVPFPLPSTSCDHRTPLYRNLLRSVSSKDDE